MFHIAQSSIQDKGHDHEYQCAHEDHAHIFLTDGGVEQAAQTSSTHEGGKHGGADGVDCGDADACDQHGDRKRDFHMEQPIGPTHSHASGRLLQVFRHLGQAERGIAYDGKQGI